MRLIANQRQFFLTIIHKKFDTLYLNLECICCTRNVMESKIKKIKFYSPGFNNLKHLIKSRSKFMIIILGWSIILTQCVTVNYLGVESAN